MGLALEDRGFDATVLCHFRRKLLEHGMERAVFNCLVNAAREAGLLTKEAEQVADSSHILGAAGVHDTYMLIRGASARCCARWATARPTTAICRCA